MNILNYLKENENPLEIDDKKMVPGLFYPHQKQNNNSSYKFTLKIKSKEGNIGYPFHSNSKVTINKKEHKMGDFFKTWKDTQKLANYLNKSPQSNKSEINITTQNKIKNIPSVLGDKATEQLISIYHYQEKLAKKFHFFLGKKSEENNNQSNEDPKQIVTDIKKRMGDDTDVRIDDLPVDIQKDVSTAVNLIYDTFPALKNKIRRILSSDQHLALLSDLDSLYSYDNLHKMHSKRVDLKKKIVEEALTTLKELIPNENDYKKIKVSDFISMLEEVNTAYYAKHPDDSIKEKFTILKDQIKNNKKIKRILDKPLYQIKDDFVKFASLEGIPNYHFWYNDMVVASKVQSRIEQTLQNSGTNATAAWTDGSFHPKGNPFDDILPENQSFIVLNNSSFTNREFYENHLRQRSLFSSSDKFALVGTSKKYSAQTVFVTHEFGHEISDLLFLTQWKGIRDLDPRIYGRNAKINVYATKFKEIQDLYDDYLKNFPKNIKEAKEKGDMFYSTYAKENIEEFIAESIADALCNKDNATDYSKKLLAIVKKIYNDKISSGDISEHFILSQIKDILYD